MSKKPKKHFIKLLAKIGYLLFFRSNKSNQFVEKSYDRISSHYDEAWTNHMRELTASMIEKLYLKEEGLKAIDLTCGTGFGTNLISEKVRQKVIGVDKSEGMLIEARKNYGQRCEFINADILEYLKTLPDDSVDVVTCCWGLGYSKPFAVLRQIKRVLRHGGLVGIIDNSLFSLKEILYCSFLTFAEYPDKLVNLMRFRFLASRLQLKLWFALAGLKPLYVSGGEKNYMVASGQAAIEKLRATGAAAGFEYAANPEDEQEIFQRFAEIIEQKYKKDNGINIIHRYLMGIAKK